MNLLNYYENQGISIWDSMHMGFALEKQHANKITIRMNFIQIGFLLLPLIIINKCLVIANLSNVHCTTDESKSTYLEKLEWNSPFP